MIQPGTYKATVLNKAISETKDGSPQAAVTFSFEAGGSSHTMTWYGSFKEKALPHTIKALLVCGLKGNNPANEVEIGKEVMVVVEEEIDEQTGKPRNKIRWVNALNAIRNVIPQDLAASKLAMLEGAVMSQRQKLGITSDDEFPF